jgi:hypothetical protein
VFPDTPVAAPTDPPVAPVAPVVPVAPVIAPPATPADLALTLASDPTTFTLNTQTPVTFAATNSGDTAAQDVQVAIQVPSTVSVSSDVTVIATGGGDSGGTGGGIGSTVLGLDAGGWTCSADDTAHQVVCAVPSFAGHSALALTVGLTPTARGSVDGISWDISASDNPTPWTGAWQPAVPVHISGASIGVAAATGTTTLADPGTADQTFTLTNAGDSGTHAPPTVAVTAPSGASVAGVSSDAGDWIATGSGWQAPSGWGIAPGEAQSLTVHLAADGSAPGDGSGGAGSGSTTLTVLGAAAADAPLDVASAPLVVEQPWASTVTAATACTGGSSAGVGAVSVTVTNLSSASTTATVGQASQLLLPGADTTVTVDAPFGADGTIPAGSVPVSLTRDGYPLGLAQQVAYPALDCAPHLAITVPAATRADNPSVVSVPVELANTGLLPATTPTVHVRDLPAGVSVLGASDGWTCAPGSGAGRAGGAGATGVRCAAPQDLAAGASTTFTLQLQTTPDVATVAKLAVRARAHSVATVDPVLSAVAVERIHVHAPWTFRPAGELVCSTSDPRTGTIRVHLHNPASGTVQARIVERDGTWLDTPSDAISIAAGDRADLTLPVAVPLTGEVPDGGVTVRVYRWFPADGLSGGGQGYSTLVDVPVAGTTCPEPALAAAGDSVSTANPSLVKATATVTNTGTAPARGVRATFDVPDGYQVVAVDDRWTPDGDGYAYARTLGVGDSARLTVTLGVDVPGDPSTGTVGVSFTSTSEASAQASIAVAAEASWAVTASADARCTGSGDGSGDGSADGDGSGDPSSGSFVTLTLTNGSSEAATATVAGQSVRVGPGATRTVRVPVDRDATGAVPAGTLTVDLARDGFDGSVTASYDGVGCARPAASVASVGQCRFDPDAQQSAADVAILLDNRRSKVPVTFEVGGGDTGDVTVAAHDQQTVTESVGEQGATYTVTAAGRTFTLDVDAVQCVPAWRWFGSYDVGDRVTDQGHVWRLADDDPGSGHGWGGHRWSVLRPAVADRIAGALHASLPWVDEGPALGD